MKFYVHERGRYPVVFGPFDTREDAQNFAVIGCVFIETGEPIPYAIKGPSAYASPRRWA